MKNLNKGVFNERTNVVTFRGVHLKDMTKEELYQTAIWFGQAHKNVSDDLDKICHNNDVEKSLILILEDESNQMTLPIREMTPYE